VLPALNPSNLDAFILILYRESPIILSKHNQVLLCFFAPALRRSRTAQRALAPALEPPGKSFSFHYQLHDRRLCTSCLSNLKNSVQSCPHPEVPPRTRPVRNLRSPATFRPGDRPVPEFPSRPIPSSCQQPVAYVRSGESTACVSSTETSNSERHYFHNEQNRFHDRTALSARPRGHHTLTDGACISGQSENRNFYVGLGLLTIHRNNFGSQVGIQWKASKFRGAPRSFRGRNEEPPLQNRKALAFASGATPTSRFNSTGSRPPPSRPTFPTER
jgi:hypothetical protein